MNNEYGYGYGYVCMYKGMKCEVYAASTYDAQKKARAKFQQTVRTRRPIKACDVMVMLAEKNGKPVVHSTGSL